MKFEPSQMASWEATKPWNLTQAEAEAQLVPGWWHKNMRGREVASWEKGYIRPTPEFYTYPEETRRAIAYHEAGHAMIEAAGGLTALDDPLSLIDLPGAQSLSYNAEEILAEGYSVLWTEPEWFIRMDAMELREVIIALARKARFPLPSNIRSASTPAQNNSTTRQAREAFQDSSNRNASFSDALDRLSDILDSQPSRSSYDIWQENNGTDSEPDWAKELSKVRAIYRGFGVPATPEIHEALFGHDLSGDWKAEEIIFKHLLRSQSLGVHWTTHWGEAAGFAGMNADRGGIRIILEAAPPTVDQIATGAEREGRGIRGWDSSGYGEREIPLRPGTPIRILRVHWAPGGPKPISRNDDGGGWMSTTYSTTKTAAMDWDLKQNSTFSKGEGSPFAETTVGEILLKAWHWHGDVQIYAWIGDVLVGDATIFTHDFPPEYNVQPNQAIGAIEVHPRYRRRGVGSAMYTWAEKLTGRKMIPDPGGNSDDAKAMWGQPNRSFGTTKTTALDPEVQRGLEAITDAPTVDWSNATISRWPEEEGRLGQIVFRASAPASNGNRKSIGYIGINDDPLGGFVISNITVAPEHRRQGWATRLLEHARSVLGDVHHSEDLSSDGRAWSRAVGQRTASGNWYHLYESDYRYANNLPPFKPGKPKWQLEELAQKILTAEGVPYGDEAFIQQAPDSTSSMVGWSMDGGAIIPGLWIGSSMMDELTVVHECAHHVDLHRKGLAGRRSTYLDTDASHNADWAAHFTRLLRRYYPDAAAYLEEAFSAHVGAKTAGTQLYRGVMLKLDARKVIEGDIRGAVLDAFDQMAQTSRRGHVGVHWTGTEDIAWNFAWGPTSRRITAGSKWSGGRGALVLNCAAVLVGRPPMSGVLDRSELMGDMAWAPTHDEDEYPVASGTKIPLDSVKVALPPESYYATIATLLERHEDRAIINEPVADSRVARYVDVTMPLVVTAKGAGMYTGSLDLARVKEIAEAASAKADMPGKSCFDASKALRDHFGWEMHGGYYDWGGPWGPEGHFWNVLPDGTIVDATHWQFGTGPDINVVKPGTPAYELYQEDDLHMMLARTASWDKRTATAAKPKKVKARDLEVGMRVVTVGHPDEPGTITKLHSQNIPYARVHATVVFDYDPDRPVQIAWDQLLALPTEHTAKTATDWMMKAYRLTSDMSSQAPTHTDEREATRRAVEVARRFGFTGNLRVLFEMPVWIDQHAPGADAWAEMDGPGGIINVRGKLINDAVLIHEVMHIVTGLLAHDEAYFRRLQHAYAVVYQGETRGWPQWAGHEAKTAVLHGGYFLTPQGEWQYVIEHFDQVRGTGKSIHQHLFDTGNIRVRVYMGQMVIEAVKPMTQKQRDALAIAADGLGPRTDVSFDTVNHLDGRAYGGAIGRRDEIDRVLMQSQNDLYAGPPRTAAKTALKPVQGPITLYHGTTLTKAVGIMAEGLRNAESQNPWRWPTLTTSFEQAARYAFSDEPAVVEMYFDEANAAQFLADAGEHNAYVPGAHAYGLRGPAPASCVVRIHNV